jgi:hypothetical protein
MQKTGKVPGRDHAGCILTGWVVPNPRCNPLGGHFQHIHSLCFKRFHHSVVIEAVVDGQRFRAGFLCVAVVWRTVGLPALFDGLARVS